jgi:deoxyguanosine kinase
MEAMSEKLIVVCGCIGAGKTTAVEVLSSALGYVGQYENYADNPFLERFYQDPRRWALPSQLYFLIEALARRPEADGGGVIQELNPTLVLEVMSGELRARGLLREEELDILRGVASVGEPVARPDLYLYLDAEPNVLRERIMARGRRMERHIEHDYLAALRARYRSTLADLRVPVLTVATDCLDIRDSADRQAVVDAIWRLLSGQPPSGMLSEGLSTV